MKSKILEANPSGGGCGQATMTIGPSAGDGSTEFQASINKLKCLDSLFHLAFKVQADMKLIYSTCYEYYLTTNERPCEDI
jgi:hypothetical protein